MRAMRRHVLYTSQEQETSVGDHAAKASVLRLWLDRRQRYLHDEPALARFLVLFWTLAKPARATALAKQDYVAFFQCVAKALVQSVGLDHAARVAARDWLYDCAGGAHDDGSNDDGSDNAVLSFEQFREALFQCADLVLPVESDASMFASFFQELRDAIASRDHGGATPGEWPADALGFRLRVLKDVAKIRGAFLQKMPPNADHLAQIRGLASPDMDQMSLKQLLLSYNPRKFALSRTFSSLFAASASAPVVATAEAAVPPETPERWQMMEEGEEDQEDQDVSSLPPSPPVVSHLHTAPLAPSHALSRESDDVFDVEDATVASIEVSPALRVAVVGPPGVGKSRVAASLAQRLRLQYVSTASVLEDALASKLLRDAARQERRRERAEAREAKEAAAADAELSTEDPADSGEAAEVVPERGEDQQGNDDDDEEPLDEADEIFGDAELAALQRGEALPREKALRVLVAFAKRWLLRGVGVVLDDVFPREAEGITLDYVVSLEMAKEDAREHYSGFTLAPTSRRVYSARERAMLVECDAVLREQGLSDSQGFVEPLDDGDEVTIEDSQLEQRRARVADAVAVAQAAFAAAKKPKAAEDGEEGERDGNEDVSPPAAGDGAGEDAMDDGVLPTSDAGSSRLLSPAERNEIEPSDEPTVPLRALLADTFDARYRMFEARAAGFASTTRTQVVAVIAAQALSDIIAQCVVAITNNSLGISRAVASRAVLPVALPEELATGGSRADQLRWLLYGEWTEALASSPPTPFATGPIEPQQPRTLSRWRECCIVSSSSSSGSSLATPVLGDLQFAAYFCGRVYLFASLTARDSFCATPLQYIRRHPPSVPSTRRLMILSSDSLESATAEALAQLVGGDHVSATDALASHHALQHVMELVDGKAVAPTADIAAIVADRLGDKPAWVVTDLIPTRDVLDTLRKRGCLPEAVVVLAPEETDANEGGHTTTPLARKKHELFAASYLEGASGGRLAELLTEMQLLATVRVLRGTIYASPSDTQAALARLLSPLTPRVDTNDEGTTREPTEADDEHARIFGPVVDDDAPPTDGGDAEDESTAAKPPLADPLGYDARQRAWIARRARMGEAAQFCAVSWTTKRVLVPGQPSFVASFQQKLYSFAGAKERAAFERNPVAYVTSAPRATQRLVPTVWLLGVRGSEADSLARLAAAACGAHMRVTMLNEATVTQRVERRLRAQLLLPADKQEPLDAVYVDELARELLNLTTSGACDAVLVVNVNVTTVRVPTQLGEEADQDSGESPPVAPPPLPTPELLARCLEQDVVPTLVLSLAGSEEVIVQGQIKTWRERLPPTRPPRKPVAADGDATADTDDAEVVDVAALEAAETARLQEQFQRDQEALTTALETLCMRGLTIDPSVAIDATSRAVVKQLAASVSALLARKDSLFESCQRVSIAQAQRLLYSGEALVGKHAMRCPLAADSATSSSLSSPAMALMYRGRLYFPASPTATMQCEYAPATSLFDTPSRPPLYRITCCVVGPPCVGKTQLARRLASQFGLTYVSPRRAVDWVLQCLGPKSALWRRLHAARSCDTSSNLDGELLHEAVATRLCSADCQRAGWVLDDYLTTPEQLARCLDGDRPAVHPGVVFVLEGSIARAWGRANRELDRERLVAGFTTWHEHHRLELVHSWTRTFGAFHVRQLDVDASSAWQVHAQATAVLQDHASALRQYVRGVAMGRAVRLHGVVRGQPTLATQAHCVFQSFCPVELSRGKYHTTLPSQRELCVECVDDTSDDEPRRIAVWLANERNLELFCSSHAAYLTKETVVRANELVAKAPVDASLLSLLTVADCEFPEMKGYCPVTFQRGTGDKDWQAIVKGSVFYRVSYEGKAFFCVSERKRRAFIAQPAVYASLVLPTKLPPQLTASTAFKSCPGRIEQELSGVLNETLLLLGATRPKFLGVSPSASACVYIALLLKTRATKALPDHIRARFAEQLRAFERDCRLGEELKSIVLPNTTTSRGPGVKGARAVRELSASASEFELQRVHALDDDTGDALRRRFDELVRSAHLDSRTSASANQAATPRSNELFLRYTTPVTKANGSSS